MSSLLVFNRVYRLEIQSVMLHFRPSFANYCSSNLLSSSPTPPLPPFPKSTYTVCGWEGMGVLSWLESKFCRSLSLCFWPDSEPTKLQHHPKKKSRKGGPQTDKHLPQSPFTGKFFYITTFGIAFYQSNLSTVGKQGEGWGLYGVYIWAVNCIFGPCVSIYFFTLNLCIQV